MSPSLFDGSDVSEHISALTYTLIMPEVISPKYWYLLIRVHDVTPQKTTMETQITYQRLYYKINSFIKYKGKILKMSVIITGKSVIFSSLRTGQLNPLDTIGCRNKSGTMKEVL